MKNETKAEKIIQTEIEKYAILKPTSMAKDIIKALKEANLISSNFSVKCSEINRAYIEGLNNKYVYFKGGEGRVIKGRLECRRGWMYLYLGKFTGNEYCYRLYYYKPANRCWIEQLREIDFIAS